jgi:hypothetical protein
MPQKDKKNFLPVFRLILSMCEMKRKKKIYVRKCSPAQYAMIE